MTPQRLYRSQTDRSIAGVAGGMADYFAIDPTVVRVLWVLAAVFSGGFAILVYLVLAIVIPLDPSGWEPGPGAASAGPAADATAGWGQPPSSGWEARRERRAARQGRGGLIAGTVLVVIGVMALANVAVPGWITGALVAPAILLAIGTILLVTAVAGREPMGTAER